MKGLAAFQFQDMVKCAPLAIKELFVHKKFKLTADDIFNLFPPQFSLQGSNRRRRMRDELGQVYSRS